MASIRRTDIMHKSFSKGRPAKTERERNKRRQEAYRWRDARRIYLANSFDKWRKLRSSLGLKDSGLAWHLMEAHEKGQCGICRRNKETEESLQVAVLPSSSPVQEFLPSLISSLRHLCHSHFQFEDCIKIVGLLCLEFDNLRKENFSVNETISSKLISESKSKDESKSHTESVSCLPPLSQLNVTSICQNTTSNTMTCQTSMFSTTTCNSSKSLGSVTMMSGNSFSIYKKKEIDKEQKTESFPACQNLSNDEDSNENSIVTHKLVESAINQQTDLSSCNNAIEKSEMPYNSANNKLTISGSGANDRREESKEAINRQNATSAKKLIHSSCDHLAEDYTTVQTINSKKDQSFRSVDFVQPSVSTSDSHSISGLSANPIAVPKLEPGVEMPLQDEASTRPDSAVELPLDMSLIKTEPKRNEALPVPLPLIENEKQPIMFPAPKGKSKDANENLHAGNLTLPLGKDDCFGKGRGRSKEESSPSIPWQRRDMSRKEEYEFLEMNPFSDLAEFSLRYPHVHQRTYYRWKRRIKEEYIILEQCPDMTFEQFSSVVLQAKETVFNLWKGFIAQGRGFFAPSADVSTKRADGKSTSTKSVNNNFSAEYLFLQKKISVTQEQFCRKYPNIPVDVFNVLKRKVIQEFWIFYQNRQLSWSEFSKILNVSEDVYNCWRDYAESMRLGTLSSDMKAALGDFSPNAQMFSSSFSPFVESPPLPADSNPQLSKDNKLDLAADSFSSQAMQLDSALNNSVSRSLSASYLSSFQNMMLPWASYYNMTNPLNQQMLPLMLWPRMLGLSSALSGPVNMNSLVSSSSSANVSPSLDMLSNVPKDALSPHMIKDRTKNDNDGFLSPKNDPKSSKPHGGKRLSENMQESDGVFEGEGSKKQRVKEDWDGGSSPYSRSRKQNKQEYVYYLKNPELCFKDLETLFPSISVRTFYRWRKEMNAAILFIEDNKGLNYQQFKLVFPDIPEDVFSSWKTKSSNLSSSRPAPNSLSGNVSSFDESREYKDVKGTSIERQGDPHIGLRREVEIPIISPSEDCNIIPVTGKSSHALEINQEAHLFVHQNPDIEFASFTQMFPDVSVHTFYHWKREWKDATYLLQATPDIDYETYKSVHGFVAKEVFNAWKVSLFFKRKDGESKDNVVSDIRKDLKANEHCNRKHYGSEFVYLQLNPHIDFSQFSQIYPDIPSHTFDKWKGDIHQVLSYVRTQPTINFSDISAIKPDISEEAFTKWKEIIQKGIAEAHDLSERKECLIETTNQVDEEAKTKMTKALLHLMHHPNMGYSDFQKFFDFVSPETFQLWLHRIKVVVQHISSNPGLNYVEFSSAITDISEDVFERWKSLTPEEISSIGTQNKDFNDMSKSPDNTAVIKDAKYYCYTYPDITYEVFSHKYPNIPRLQFNQWMSKILDEISFIRDNPGLTFQDFNKVYEDVSETIFDLWKVKSFSQYPMPIKMEVSEDIGPVHMDPVSVKEEETVLEANGTTINSLEAQSIISQTPSSNQNHPNHGKENEGLTESESSLSKLTKFAESDVSLYTRWTPGKHTEQDNSLLSNNGSMVSSQDQGASSSHDESSPSLETQCKSHLENDIDNNNINFNGLYNSGPPRPSNITGSVVNKLLNPLSTNISMKNFDPPSPEMQKSPLKFEREIEGYNTSVSQKQVVSENKSLSALMVMSTNKTSLPVSSSNFMHDNVKAKPKHSSSSSSWNPGQVGIKDDDEIFSSQRQKKMSRAEYLFVKDNPDVDSQEFARIFPGVSARTFYRWKKEIKAQIQIP